jgi:anti-sigma factor (TIGR02949 family)
MKSLSRFTCEETFRRLDDYLDRELAPEEAQLLREHLNTCIACAQEFRFEESVIVNVKRKVRQLDVPDDLESRILAALQGRPPGS